MCSNYKRLRSVRPSFMVHYYIIICSSEISVNMGGAHDTYDPGSNDLQTVV
jgi:hypothetical protein